MMLYFGASRPRMPMVRSESEERQLVPVTEMATPQTRNHHIRMNDRTAVEMAALRLEEPDTFEVINKHLADLTRKGDNYTFNLPGENDSEVRAEEKRNALSMRHKWNQLSKDTDFQALTKKLEGHRIELQGLLGRLTDGGESASKIASSGSSPKLTAQDHSLDPSLLTLESSPQVPMLTRDELAQERLSKKAQSRREELKAKQSDEPSSPATATTTNEKTAAQIERQKRKNAKAREKKKAKRSAANTETTNVPAFDDKKFPFSSKSTTPTKGRSRANSFTKP